jgi:hypothetical protein
MGEAAGISSGRGGSAAGGGEAQLGWGRTAGVGESATGGGEARLLERRCAHLRRRPGLLCPPRPASPTG